MQYDEAATGYFAALPFADLWGAPAVLEPNPPLFYSLARLVRLCGGDVEQMRLLSAVAGILSIPVAWRIGALLGGRFAAAAAAWLVALSPQNIALSQYARAYATLDLCLLIAFLCLLLARRTAAWPPWLGYVAAAAASLYLHHTAIVVLAAMGVATLATAGTRQGMARLLAAGAAVVLLYVPWLPVLAAQAMPGGGTPTQGVSPGVVRRIATAAFRPFPFHGLPWTDAWPWPLAAIGASRTPSRDMAALLGTIGGGILAMVAISQVRPMLDGKTLGWAGLFVLVAAASGLAALARLRWPVLALILMLQLWAVAASVRDGDAAREGWREVATLLQHDAQPGDTLFLNDAGAVLALRHYGWPEERFNIRFLARQSAEAWFRDAPGSFGAGADDVAASAANNRTWLLTHNAMARRAALVTQARVPELAAVRTGKLDVSLLGPPLSSDGSVR